MAGDGLVTRGTAKVSWGESGATCSVPGRTATWLTQSGRRLMPTARGGTHSPSPPRLGEAVRAAEGARSLTLRSKHPGARRGPGSQRERRGAPASVLVPRALWATHTLSQPRWVCSLSRAPYLCWAVPDLL